jgi:hypothetical protein
MTAIRVDFTSHVDKKGYKIVPAKRPPRQPGQTEADWVLGARSGVDWIEARIVGLGGERKAVRLANYPMLFTQFAGIRTAEELLKFVTVYGPLTPAGAAGGKGDEIPPLLDAAAKMQSCFGRRKPPMWPIANLRAWLSNDKTKGTIYVKMGPTRLLDALWLQLGQSLAGGAEWRQCKRCGDWFPVGGKSGRRLVARFCSNEHRIEFNSLKRSR